MELRPQDVALHILCVTNDGAMSNNNPAKLPLAAIPIALIACLVAAGIVACADQKRPTAGVRDAMEDSQSNEGADPVERLLQKLTLEQKIAQLFVVTPEDITGVDVATAAGEVTRQALLKYPVGGICYFAQNLQSPEQTKGMLQNVQDYSKQSCGLPLFACVDEEGGTVARVAGNEEFGVEDVGNMSAIGASGDVKEAEDAAYYVGSYLSDLGFTVDFAPVADIATSSDGTMSLRSFGQSPDDVAPMVAAQVRGFGKAGILCAAKHFPGIGAAEGDSHDGSISTDATIEEMASWSLVPFAAAIKERVPFVMVGHLTCTGLDNVTAELPASLNSGVIEGILRKRLGFDGLVITDSLQMGAVTQVCEPNQQAVFAIRAGADMVLMPQDFESAYNGLLEAVQEGEVLESRIDESVRRVIAAKLALDK